MPTDKLRPEFSNIESAFAYVSSEINVGKSIVDIIGPFDVEINQFIDFNAQTLLIRSHVPYVGVDIYGLEHIPVGKYFAATHILLFEDLNLVDASIDKLKEMGLDIIKEIVDEILLGGSKFNIQMAYQIACAMILMYDRAGKLEGLTQ